MSIHVAVIGATGLVGSLVLDVLAERKFPIKSLKLLASERSVGKKIAFQGREYPVELAEPAAFEGVDLVFACAGGATSAQLIPEAVKRGAVVIDKSSLYRLDPDVPLVVAGVNDEDLRKHQGIIANPNCSTSQLMPVLKALDEAFGLKRVIVSTYQSVSGAGKAAIDELMSVTQEALNSPSRSSQTHHAFQRPMGFNLIPQIDQFVSFDEHEDASVENGYTKEETKLIRETRKILHLPNLAITATAVRVPVFISHSESVTVECLKPVSPEEARRVLKLREDLVVSERPEDYPTPLDAAGKDPVYVGRIRRDTSCPETGLNLWVVGDNLRIGAALNAVRLAEYLLKQSLLSKPCPA
ncbi:MAG: aspartate-semialdehyde dehydrogenase [Cyanobacteria bacterium]|nr:aspartate-semialdehyde dehydrogenase [Cyanobacteriota bacterium]